MLPEAGYIFSLRSYIWENVKCAMRFFIRIKSIFDLKFFPLWWPFICLSILFSASPFDIDMVWDTIYEDETFEYEAANSPAIFKMI